MGSYFQFLGLENIFVFLEKFMSQHKFQSFTIFDIFIPLESGLEMFHIKLL